MPTKLEWQQLAEDRILDAAAHLAAGVDRWSAAFYLIGYAVECGLKACLLAQVGARPEMIYETKRFSQEAWTHDFETLLKLAGLESARDLDAAADVALYQNWQKIKYWNQHARYVHKTESQARELFDAVADPVNGVMRWIRAHW